MKPKRKEKLILVPKIQYMDETAESKVFELEQLAVTVRELGICGWLRGPD